MKTKDKKRNDYHLKQYDKIVQPMYENIHYTFNDYILSFKKNDDKFVAECHCLYNFFIFGLARLKLFSQKTKDEKFTFFDFMSRINEKAQIVGMDNEKLNGSY